MFSTLKVIPGKTISSGLLQEPIFPYGGPEWNKIIRNCHLIFLCVIWIREISHISPGNWYMYTSQTIASMSFPDKRRQVKEHSLFPLVLRPDKTGKYSYLYNLSISHPQYVDVALITMEGFTITLMLCSFSTEM